MWAGKGEKMQESKAELLSKTSLLQEHWLGFGIEQFSDVSLFFVTYCLLSYVVFILIYTMLIKITKECKFMIHLPLPAHTKMSTV